MAKFPKIDWNTEYPPPKPFSTARKPCPKLRSKIQKEVMRKKVAEGFKPFPLTPSQDASRREKIKSTQRKRRDERLKSFIPKVKQALRKNSNKRKDAAKYLGVKPSYLSKIMLQTKKRHLKSESIYGNGMAGKKIVKIINNLKKINPQKSITF